MRLTSTFVFLTTALIGVLVAYDEQLALRRFGLIALGIVFMALLVWISGTDMGEVAIGSAAYLALWAAGVIAVFYLFDLRQTSGGLSAGAARMLQPAAPLASIALDNATAGALVLLTPIGAASLDWLWQRRRPGGGLMQMPVVLAFAALIPLLVAFVALFATGSRGAWLSLGMGVSFAVYLRWRSRARRIHRCAGLAMDSWHSPPSL